MIVVTGGAGFIGSNLVAGLEARGWKVHTLETAPLSARFTVSDPATGQECEVDILKEIFWRPVAQSPYGPVLAEEDVIGTKVRALADRGAPRDLIDVLYGEMRNQLTRLRLLSPPTWCAPARRSFVFNAE